MVPCAYGKPCFRNIHGDIQQTQHDTPFCRLTHTPATANEIMSTFRKYLESFDNKKEGIRIASIMQAGTNCSTFQNMQVIVCVNCFAHESETVVGRTQADTANTCLPPGTPVIQLPGLTSTTLCSICTIGLHA